MRGESVKIEISITPVDGVMENGRTFYHCIERIVLVDGEEVYRDRQKNALFCKDESVLRQFEDWCNELLFENSKHGSDATCNPNKLFSLVRKFWLKLFG